MSINKKYQQGVMLLEALMGLLIFSFGILAFIGMQANAISNTTETKFRSDASFLASQLSSQIWADKANVGSYVYTGGAIPSKLTAWSDAVKGTLPGVGTVGSSSFEPGMNPTILLTGSIGTTTELTITLHWKQPSATVIRQYQTVILVNN